MNTLERIGVKPVLLHLLVHAYPLSSGLAGVGQLGDIIALNILRRDASLQSWGD